MATIKTDTDTQNMNMNHENELIDFLYKAKTKRKINKFYSFLDLT